MGFLKNLVKAGIGAGTVAAGIVGGPAAGAAAGAIGKGVDKAMTPKPAKPTASVQPKVQSLSASSLGEARSQDKARMSKQYPGLGVA